MPKTNLAAALGQFANLSKQNIRYVLNEAVQDVMDGAMTPQRAISAGAASFEVGKIPVDTATLINSVVINGAKYGGAVELNGGGIDTFEWQTPYAARIEYGFNGADKAGRVYNQAGRFFVTTHALRFAEFVQQHAMEISK